MGRQYRVSASAKSFNNELGVPLTVLDTPDDTEAVVIEMGARGRGHVASLCAVARPLVGVVTTVGLSHSEFFGTVRTSPWPNQSWWKRCRRTGRRS